jgi:dTDP-4-dehydrorhamnose reductase
MCRLAVTGAGGFVAGSAIRQAASESEVHALSGKKPLAEQHNLVWHTLDLKDPSIVKTTIIAISPDVVIHAAAIGDIDFCEKNPPVARVANVDLTASVAEACSHCGARLIFLSTDTVFDGARGRYLEDDLPSPINEYARTKAVAEKVVAATLVDSVIARCALVMGFGLLGTGNSFLDRTLPMFREGRPIYVPAEEIRTPIDVVTLGKALLELAGADFCGVIHLAGNEALDRVSLTRRLATRLGFSPDVVVPRLAVEMAGRALRPRDVSLQNDKARSLLKTPMHDFDSALDLILAK